MTQRLLPDWVGDYIGLPFADRGRDRNGVDCWGLVRLVYQEVWGVAMPAYDDGYIDTGRTCFSDIAVALTDHCMASTTWRRIDAGAEAVGDMALFQIMGLPVHVGLVVASTKMIHAETGTNVVLDRYDGLRWGGRLIGFWRPAWLKT